MNPSEVHRLPPAIRDVYVSAFSNALTTVFLVAAAIVTVAFLLSWLLEERPLRQTVDTAGVGEAFASPKSDDPLQELIRELSLLVGGPRTLAFLKLTTERAGLDLTPAEAWLLLRFEEGLSDPDELAATWPIKADRARELKARLVEDGLADEHGLTEPGRDAAERLTEARREGLRSLVDDWNSDADPRVNEVIARLADQLGGDVPVLAGAAA